MAFKMRGPMAPPKEYEEEIMEPEVPEPSMEIKEESYDLFPQHQVIYTTLHCDSCKHFLEDGKDCAKVKGPISGKDGWCVLHSGREAQEKTMENEVPDVAEMVG